MDILQIIHNVNYYVYEHYLDGELFYIGKGKGKRCLDLESRSNIWKAKVNGREEDVVIKVVETFVEEEDALRFEKRRIIQLSKTHQLTNITFNNPSYEYNEETYVKEMGLSVKRPHPNKVYENKMYLSEIIEKENVEFGNNNLILAPTNSGKTTFAKSLIQANIRVLFLVSTTSSKISLISHNEKDKNKTIEMCTMESWDSEEENCKTLVATYYELGEKIIYTDDFAEQFDLIICDEIHSLPFYRVKKDSIPLMLAIKYLFKYHENQIKYYFTATRKHIDLLAERSNEIMRNILFLNYLNHPNIAQNIPLLSYEITSFEQYKIHLEACKKSFQHFGHKIIIFCENIYSQNRLKNICEKEGFYTQTYWFPIDEDSKMTNEQKKELENIFNTGLLSNDYDVIIMNSARQEGWNLLDKRVKLAIIDTASEVEQIQSLGRIRKNLEVLLYRINKTEETNCLSVPKEYLDKRLTSKRKQELCEKLNLRNKAGILCKWTTISKILKNQGFLITDKNSMINGKKTRTSTIHSKKM